QSSFVDRLFVLLPDLVPQHLLSRLVGWCARSEIPWIKTTFINQFSNRFDIDLSEAVIEDPDQFPSFNAFFTRALKDGARPIAPEANDIACPADGTISQLGKLRGSDVLQAKGQYYSVYELL